MINNRLVWYPEYNGIITAYQSGFRKKTIQGPADVQGEMVYDCRPPLLPVSLEMSNIGPLSVRTTVVAASVAVPPLVWALMW